VGSWWVQVGLNASNPPCSNPYAQRVSRKNVGYKPKTRKFCEAKKDASRPKKIYCMAMQ
jgi:hypothetical protein